MLLPLQYPAPCLLPCLLCPGPPGPPQLTHAISQGLETKHASVCDMVVELEMQHTPALQLRLSCQAIELPASMQTKGSCKGAWWTGLIWKLRY